MIYFSGMFLWLRLVLGLLETAGSLEELRSTVDSLPRDLEEMQGAPFAIFNPLRLIHVILWC